MLPSKSWVRTTWVDFLEAILVAYSIKQIALPAWEIPKSRMFFVLSGASSSKTPCSSMIVFWIPSFPNKENPIHAMAATKADLGSQFWSNLSAVASSSVSLATISCFVKFVQTSTLSNFRVSSYSFFAFSPLNAAFSYFSSNPFCPVVTKMTACERSTTLSLKRIYSG